MGLPFRDLHRGWFRDVRPRSGLAASTALPPYRIIWVAGVAACIAEVMGVLCRRWGLIFIAHTWALCGGGSYFMLFPENQELLRKASSVTWYRVGNALDILAVMISPTRMTQQCSRSSAPGCTSATFLRQGNGGLLGGLHTVFPP